MLNSKQRAALRGMANTMDTIFQIGKDGLGESFYRQVDEARELIMLGVLESSMLGAREAAADIAAHCNADVVQVIGSRFVLYRPSKEKKITI